jgi:chemotaxis response regulator CheB
MAKLHIGVVHESALLRNVVSLCLGLNGFKVVCNAAYMADISHFTHIDYWLVSQKLIADKHPICNKVYWVIDGLLPVPDMSEDLDGEMQKWTANLLRKFNAYTTQDKQPATPKLASKTNNKIAHWLKYRPLPLVLVIGAVAGGTAVVNTLLQALHPHAALRVVLVQHHADIAEPGKHNALVGNTAWNIASIGDELQAGKLYVLPATKQVRMLATGKVAVLEDGWQGHYKPSVDTVFTQFSSVLGPSMLGLVMCTMPENVGFGLRRVVANGGLIGLQSGDATTVSSHLEQLKHMGEFTFDGSVVQLARQISNMIDYLSK